MESIYTECWNIAQIADSFSILRDDLVSELGGDNYLFCEGELLISISLAKSIYKDALNCIKRHRKTGEDSENLKEFLDLSVLINGELALA